ncbi:MAG: chemotaxis protein CheW [Bacillota bacterium]|nr:chemotaxis protein CheW [Bacillota bacterium]
MEQELANRGEERQLVVFGLAGELFGIEIAAVQEIIRMQNVTKLPNMPDFVEGVTNLRGKVIPVMNLRKRFRLPDAPQTATTRIIVVEMNGTVAGMVVDAVQEVLRVSADQIEPLREVRSSVDAEYLLGVAKVGERLIILLDLAKVWALQESRDPLAVAN